MVSVLFICVSSTHYNRLVFSRTHKELIYCIMGRVSLQKRETIVQMHEEGSTQVHISKALKISRRAVQYTLNKHRSHASLLDKPRTGRPRKLSLRDKRKILVTSKRNRFATARTIRQESGFADRVCLSTVKKVLREGGQLGRIAVRKPYLTSIHKRKRRLFCQLKVSFTKCDWDKYVFTDECILHTDGAKRAYVRRPKGSAMNAIHLKQTRKFPPHIMVWGAIRSDGRRVLVRANEPMDSLEYQRVLNEGLPVIYNQRFVMQQDGARCHTSKSSMDYLTQRRIRLLPEWPAQSPDLNIIEHMWQVLKLELQKKRVATKEELWIAAKEIWKNIPNSVIDTLYQSLPFRVRAVVNARGGNTRY